MPLVFILYIVIYGRDEIRGVELLILSGMFLDRYLFIVSAEFSS
jgi:hypothetical protein